MLLFHRPENQLNEMNRGSGLKRLSVSFWADTSSGSGVCNFSSVSSAKPQLFATVFFIINTVNNNQGLGGMERNVGRGEENINIVSQEASRKNI